MRALAWLEGRFDVGFLPRKIARHVERVIGKLSVQVSSRARVT